MGVFLPVFLMFYFSISQSIREWRFWLWGRKRDKKEKGKREEEEEEGRFVSAGPRLVTRFSIQSVSYKFSTIAKYQLDCKCCLCRFDQKWPFTFQTHYSAELLRLWIESWPRSQCFHCTVMVCGVEYTMLHSSDQGSKKDNSLPHQPRWIRKSKVSPLWPSPMHLRNRQRERMKM